MSIELKQAAQAALEQLEFLNACYPHKTAADAVDALRTAIQQAEAHPREPVYQICKADSVSISTAWVDVQKQQYDDAALYPEYGRRVLYTHPDPGVPDNTACKSVQKRLEAQRPATGEPVAWVVMNGVSKYQVCGAKAPADALCSEMQKRHDLSGSLAAFHVQPLYTHPASGVPIGYMNAGNIHELKQGELPYGYVYPQKESGVSVPVYTHPAPAAAVSDEQINGIVWEYTRLNPNQAADSDLVLCIRKAVRAILALRPSGAVTEGEKKGPLLVRDVAEIVGCTVHDVSRSLVGMGKQPHSTNMALTPDEAVAVCKALRQAQPAASVSDEREAFEAWYFENVNRAELPDYLPTLETYSSATVANLFCAWKARAALRPAQAGVPDDIVKDAQRYRTAKALGYQFGRHLYQGDPDVDWLSEDDIDADMLAAAPKEGGALAQAGVPDGWRLVPVEPTPEMKAAGIKVEVYSEASDSIGALTWDEVKAIYRAMLAAAPNKEGGAA